MCGAPGPARRCLAGGFDGVTDVLPVALPNLTDPLPAEIPYRQAIARVRSHLFATDVKFRGTVDRGNSRTAGWALRVSVQLRSTSLRLPACPLARSGRPLICRPIRPLDVLTQSFPSTLAAKP